MKKGADFDAAMGNRTVRLSVSDPHHSSLNA